MALTIPFQRPVINPAKRMRRNATAVMAGAFDIRPARDVLTSLLNGVPPYYPGEKDEEARRIRKLERREKRERERERKRRKLAEINVESEVAGNNAIPGSSAANIQLHQASTAPPTQTWASRPTIQFATCSRERSESVTPPSPPPLASSPYSTPGPSNSSSTSRTSSKRPHTPDDDEDIMDLSQEPRGKQEEAASGQERLEGLDAVPILQERRTRSGKNFDAIGVGKEGWISGHTCFPPKIQKFSYLRSRSVCFTHDPFTRAIVNRSAFIFTL
ncbi:hypothetical protein BDP27DRAFT_1417559 [Rhodocollybia butyracea]|uniref:Uncharacterized protein n=1 Tax=Rhodocollybia butyracea TaxID=206335 RepID=A0A9P5PVA1_9AGAR|nr:hypothetical protein BDP27DRAFT_1417559 [Rhodocollybia butyracea]